MKKKTAIETIRAHCLDCSCGSSKEVELCKVTSCVLFNWRFGIDPNDKKVLKS